MLLPAVLWWRTCTYEGLFRSESYHHLHFSVCAHQRGPAGDRLGKYLHKQRLSRHLCQEAERQYPTQSVTCWTELKAAVDDAVFVCWLQIYFTLDDESFPWKSPLSRAEAMFVWSCKGICYLLFLFIQRNVTEMSIQGGTCFSNFSL